MRRVEDKNVELISIIAINEELRIVTFMSHFHELKAEYSTSLSWKSEDFYIVNKRWIFNIMSELYSASSMRRSKVDE